MNVTRGHVYPTRFAPCPTVFPSDINQTDSCASAEVTDTAGGEVSSREKEEKKSLKYSQDI